MIDGKNKIVDVRDKLSQTNDYKIVRFVNGYPNRFLQNRDFGIHAINLNINPYYINYFNMVVIQ
jgi:hypothetical protein